MLKKYLTTFTSMAGSTPAKAGLKLKQKAYFCKKIKHK
jgi:hypothetical protein